MRRWDGPGRRKAIEAPPIAEVKYVAGRGWWAINQHCLCSLNSTQPSRYITLQAQSPEIKMRVVELVDGKEGSPGILEPWAYNKPPHIESGHHIHKMIHIGPMPPEARPATHLRPPPRVWQNRQKLAPLLDAEVIDLVGMTL